MTRTNEVSCPRASAKQSNLEDYVGEEEGALMEWQIKAHPNWMVPMNIAQIVLLSVPARFMLYGYYLADSPESRESTIDLGWYGFFFAGFLCWAGRKKTVFKYSISQFGGVVESWGDYFQYTKYIFKGIAVLAGASVLAMIVIAPDMILAIAGVGGMVILGSIKLMAWENTVEVRRFTWDRPQCIFTDRKRGMVVLERRVGPDIPFVENYMYVQVFLPKKRIDEFLALCRKYAPNDVEYDEGHFRE